MAGQSLNAFKVYNNNLPCSKQVINTQLSSPNEEIIKTLKKGDVLAIELISSRHTLVALFEDEIAGVIVNKEMIKLIDCIKKGQSFEAVIRNIIGGMCAITIKSINSL